MCEIYLIGSLHVQICGIRLRTAKQSASEEDMSVKKRLKEITREEEVSTKVYIEQKYREPRLRIIGNKFRRTDTSKMAVNWFLFDASLLDFDKAFV